MIRGHDLCLCGHSRDYHHGPSFAATYPHKAYWCCEGNFPKRKCRCPRFRRAIAQPSDRERIENAGRP